LFINLSHEGARHAEKAGPRNTEKDKSGVKFGSQKQARKGAKYAKKEHYHETHEAHEVHERRRIKSGKRIMRISERWFDDKKRKRDSFLRNPSRVKRSGMQTSHEKK
jgi:hypothetical protein